MIYQKLTTGMGQCLLLIRKHADRDGFELWRRKERCWCYFNNVGAEYFKEFFENGEIYLFGSRVDDSKKGGDIDLYLEVKDHSNLFEKKLKFLSRVKKELGDQKIDVVFNTESSRLIEKEALQWGIKL